MKKRGANIKGIMMFNLFYALFKYKEKAQKDELGYYPEKVDVRAFPERRFLWTSRFFVVISCLSICVSMMLGSALCVLIPQKSIGIYPLQIDYQLYQITMMSPSNERVYAGDLVTESVLAEYIKKRYTITDDYELLKKHYGEKDFLFLSSSQEVYDRFYHTEMPYFEMMQRRGVRREVKIKRIYPVSFDFWQVRFQTIDTAPDMDVDSFMDLMKVNLETVASKPKQGAPLISNWIATLRMNFNFHKFEDKDLGLVNPYGLTVFSYDVSFAGNNIKSKRN